MGKVLSLTEYQQGAYRVETAELDEVLSLIKKVLPLYKYAFLDEYWPYIAQNGAVLQPYATGKYSISTNAMIMVMLLSIRNKIGFTIEKKDIEKNIAKAKTKYFREVFENNVFYSSSKSYGVNDPLNLYWACILCDEDIIENTYTDSVNSKIKEKIFDGDKPRELNCLLEFPEDEKIDQQKHSFIALYAYRCAISAKHAEDVAEKYYNFFELRLHQHLSFKSIPDSRFDPAELVFCLEGMLLSKPSSVSSEILHRVFEVLGEAQDITPCWRPVNPVYATPQGQIFLPLSIEVGLSLLNIFDKIDSDSMPQSYFAKYLPMLQRYFRWLKAQEKTIRFLGKDSSHEVSGWESEHVGNEGVIHIWQTALILDYLASYAKLLKKHIAKQYLIFSGLSVSYSGSYKKDKNCIFADSNPFPKQLKKSGFIYNVPKIVFEKFILSRQNKKCDFNKASLFDPLLKSKCLTCSSVEKKCNGENEKLLFSLLLYGPPGTGKSFFSKEVARCLGWKHITVTPSDFLADGSAEIEARAKGIFSCLMEQENAVILFDEIDQFVLDRDSERYNSQSDVFKLLTPGMLPKFQDLRDNKKCIFIVATNYAERIDPAITRLGRIDIKVPLMPPNWEKRKEMILEGLSEFGFNDDLCVRIANKTPLYTWNELKKLIGQLAEQSAEILSEGDNGLSLINAMDNCIVANLTFKKALQRLGCDGQNLESMDFEHHRTQTVIEELALMCLVSAGNSKYLESVFDNNFSNCAKLHDAVRTKAHDLMIKYNYYEQCP